MCLKGSVEIHFCLVFKIMYYIICLADRVSLVIFTAEMVSLNEKKKQNKMQLKKTTDNCGKKIQGAVFF